MVASWFEFFLYAVSKVVAMVFSLDTGLGFSFGDLDVALLLIGIVAAAFLIKTGSFAFVRHDVVNNRPHRGNASNKAKGGSK